MKRFLALVLLVLAPACTLFGGSNISQPAAQVTDARVQLLARGSVQALEDAWNATGQACYDASGAMGGAEGRALRTRCQDVLMPARQALHDAALLTDGWTSADQKNFICATGEVVSAVENVWQLLNQKEPPLVHDALVGVASFGTAACEQDGGAQ